MPQDTLYSKNDSANYIVSDSDAATKVVKQYLEHGVIDLNKENKKSSEWFPLFFVLGMFAVIWIIIRIRDGKSKGYVALGSMVKNETDFELDENGDPIQEREETEEPGYLVYEGSELNFTDAELDKILNRRSTYFISLADPDKEKFIHRLQKFINIKSFFIHDKTGFKEMPVLISAAAIQLSFGLDKYLLPSFPNIHIFPEEFISTHPSIRFLEGNVSDNSINISWKHFLKGFNVPDDGQNVGLHEMAHAYYFQNFETTENIDHDFVHTFSKFNDCGNSAFVEEQIPGNDFYSEYAMRNFQEFWAESVEIFFERPTQLKMIYPDLYGAISDLLNQDPATVV